MRGFLVDPSTWAALVTLTALEVLLGVDNVIFVSLAAANLDPGSSRLARRMGLLLALAFRIALLFALTNLRHLRYPIFILFGKEVSWGNTVLIGGGVFLIAKATFEIHGEFDIGENDKKPSAATNVLVATIQIAVIDLVFSIDSIVTAIGMTQRIEVMIAAVLIAMVVMYAASTSVARFIIRHPTTKMLALSFLILIGVALIADGFDVHIPRGYIYFAMAFASAVEVINIFARQLRGSDRSRRR